MKQFLKKHGYDSETGKSIPIKRSEEG